MSKTLSESAAEILQASMMAGKEPAAALTVAQDLGGQTPESMDAGSVGSNAADAVNPAPKPGVEGTPAEPAEKVVKAEVAADEEEAVEDTMDAMEETEDEDEDKDEDDAEEMKSKMKKEMVERYRGSMREDVDALFNGESLSEDFRVKATLIFESAVSSRVEKIVEEVLAENDELLAQAIEEIKSELSEQVDEYLNYVVEEWVKDNQVAIETGLRAELVEDFISGLKNLFAEHYIELPEEKVDVAEELAVKVVELEGIVEDLSTVAQTEISSLVEELNAVKKEKAIRLACEGLTEVQAGKMKSLAEGVEFTADGDFENKLAVIRENYFPSKTSVKSEVKAIQETAVNEEPEVVQASGIMAHYVKALSKTAPKA
jgi:hypothetical protein